MPDRIHFIMSRSLAGSAMQSSGAGSDQARKNDSKPDLQYQVLMPDRISPMKMQLRTGSDT